MKLINWLKEKWHIPVGFILSWILIFFSGLMKNLTFSYFIIGILASIGIYDCLESINMFLSYRKKEKEIKEKWAKYFSEFNGDDNDRI